MTKFDPEMGFTQRVRHGLPQMKPKMLRVLFYLEECKKQGFPWAHLPMELKGYKHSLRAMLRPPRCWIMASAGLDGVRYKLMPAGEKALEVYRPVVKRRDGICPSCGIRPRRQYPSGKLCAYCTECENKSKRRQWQLKGRQLCKESPCSRCKQRPRRVNSAGNLDLYCAECRKATRKDQRVRRRQRALERVQNGEVLLCRKCKSAPRWVSGNWIYDYCHDCYREYQNKRYRASRAASEG